MKFDVKDINLAQQGKLRIEWAEREMPVLRLIRRHFLKNKPLKGLTLGCCLHVTTETANLMIALKEGGARPFLCASNPLSTQDDVASALVKYWSIPVFAIKWENNKTYYSHIKSVIDASPDITMDDGADLVTILHTDPKYIKTAKKVIGGTEETTTGVIRLRAMQNEGVLKYPVIAINDAMTKHLFDNRYGTGQSTIDGILRATNVLIAGKTFVVCGYGWCGRGVAMRAKGMGANVIITEVNPLKALEALMDGYFVMPISQAAKIGDIFVTLTGDVSVIENKHFQLMKDGAIVANSGHFNVELDLVSLKKISKKTRKVREFVEEFTLRNGKKVFVLGEGRLINLAAAEGHPANVMDMSFANQSLSVEFLKKNAKTGALQKKVFPVPQEIDEKIAELKLKAVGVKIDRLSKRQEKYLKSWSEGT